LAIQGLRAMPHDGSSYHFRYHPGPAAYAEARVGPTDGLRRSCGGFDGGNVVPATAADGGSYGAVYTITNAASGNGVVYYRSASDGTLPSIRVSRAREYQMASSLAR
jgi:hypothetical protein